MEVQVIFLIAAGIFSVVAAIANWDWFMNHHKAQFFVKLVGRTGARVFYGLLGVALSSIGVLNHLGFIS